MVTLSWTSGFNPLRFSFLKTYEARFACVPALSLFTYGRVASDTAVGITRVGRAVRAVTYLRSASKRKAVEPVFGKTLLWFPALRFNY